MRLAIGGLQMAEHLWCFWTRLGAPELRRGIRPMTDHVRDTGGFHHLPVMVREIVAVMADVPDGVFVDATVGGGGHSEAILDAHGGLSLVGFDQDPSALRAAGRRLARFGDRVDLRRVRFDGMQVELDRRGVASIVGFLFDLGVSSPQLDFAERGFSYRNVGPLDMRMDPDAELSAAVLVNGSEQAELSRILRDFGDERYAARVAAAIVRERPIADTAALAEIVREAIPAPARRRGGHPAKRTFQALRIAVNAELSILPDALDQAIALLVASGRGAVLAYHSGEDRIVKDRFLQAETGGCTCPPRLPCGCGAIRVARLLTRSSRKPSAAEIAANPRAQSARLRTLEKLVAA